jgi:DNA repair protein RecO (recombination protein O)
MSRPPERQSAWLLHSRPFRDTSVLLDFLTDTGRVSAIARGARGPRSKYKALLQPFQPLTISLFGRSELLNLRDAEAAGQALVLTGERLFSALYVNELMVRLLHGHEGEAALFSLYSAVLAGLGTPAELEPLLRDFELSVLEALGFGLQFSHEAETGEVLAADGWYYLHQDTGFVRQRQNQVQEPRHDSAHNLYPGHELHKIAERDFAGGSTRVCAKRLLRQVLQHHMSERPLTSRELFMEPG